MRRRSGAFTQIHFTLGYDINEFSPRIATLIFHSCRFFNINSDLHTKVPSNSGLSVI